MQGGPATIEHPLRADWDPRGSCAIRTTTPRRFSTSGASFGNTTLKRLGLVRHGQDLTLLGLSTARGLSVCLTAMMSQRVDDRNAVVQPENCHLQSSCTLSPTFKWSHWPLTVDTALS